MAKIPLNKFRNRLIEVNTFPESFYDTPVNRATILVNAQATNSDITEKTISLYISEGPLGTKIPLVKNFSIPGNDSRSLLAGRVVLEGIDGTTDPTTQFADYLWAEASAPGVFLSISLLETVNKT